MKGFIEVKNDAGDTCYVAVPSIVMLRPLAADEMTQWPSSQSYILLQRGEAGTAVQETVGDLLDLIQGCD